MNKKILGIFVTLLAVAMLSTPYIGMVSAVPGAEKKNEKFLSFEMNKIGGPPAEPPVIIFHPAPPKEAQFQRVIVHETMVFGEIIINGGVPYVLPVDFTYESTLTLDFHLNSEIPFATITVDQALVFKKATSGLDGRLEVQLVGKFWPAGRDGLGPAESWGSAVGHGTGDLEGVKLVATGWHLPTGVIHYEGYVTGWPGLP